MFKYCLGTIEGFGVEALEGRGFKQGIALGVLEGGGGVGAGQAGKRMGGGGGGIFFFWGGGSCRITDTSKKPQPEHQNNVCGNLPIKSRFCPKTLPSEAFFCLAHKFRLPKITDTVKPQRKRCFRQEDFGGSERLGGGGCGRVKWVPFVKLAFLQQNGAFFGLKNGHFRPFRTTF